MCTLYPSLKFLIIVIIYVVFNLIIIQEYVKVRGENLNWVNSIQYDFVYLLKRNMYCTKHIASFIDVFYHSQVGIYIDCLVIRVRETLISQNY